MASEETCANCHRLIGALEEAFVWKDNIVCRECYERLCTPKWAVPSTPATPEALSSQAPSPVYIHQSGKSTSGFGIAALVLGILACLFCWIPVLGLLSVPLAGLGLLFGVIGILVSAGNRRSGIGLPIAGAVVCAVAIVIALGITGLLVGAVQSASEDAKEATEVLSASELAEEVTKVLEEESEDIEQQEIQSLFQRRPIPEVITTDVPFEQVARIENVPVFFIYTPYEDRDSLQEIINLYKQRYGSGGFLKLLFFDDRARAGRRMPLDDAALECFFANYTFNKSANFERLDYLD